MAQFIYSMSKVRKAVGDKVILDDVTLSFRDLDERSTAFAAHLAACGVEPGDRVAVMTTNRPEFLAAVHGAGVPEVLDEVDGLDRRGGAHAPRPVAGAARPAAMSPDPVMRPACNLEPT